MWLLQFGMGLVAILLGAYTNGGERKYIPADPSALPLSCQKAYVNVYASSQEEAGAIICCNGGGDKWAWLIGSYEGFLCTPKPNWLLFSGRLTRFPDCWLLPLAPFILRLLVKLLGVNRNQLGQEKLSGVSSHTISRIVMYIIVMNFRGWVLFIFLNQVEDVVAEKLSLGFDDTTLASCWFKPMLKSRMQVEDCYGKGFDFSDHIVLFFGHILPVALFEVSFCFLFPFWSQQREGIQQEQNVKPLQRMRHFLSRLVPALLLFGFLYLDFITFLETYRTAAYFHTGAETAVGFAISLLIQIPLGYIMFSERWGRIRQLIGLSSSGHED